MVRMPVNGEVVTDESALRALYEGLHLGEPLPDHEPDRYARAAGFFQTVIKGGKRRGMVGIYNREDLDRARRNAERLAWARDMVDQIVRGRRVLGRVFRTRRSMRWCQRRIRWR